jgi:hypothetical protein
MEPSPITAPPFSKISLCSKTSSTQAPPPSGTAAHAPTSTLLFYEKPCLAQTRSIPVPYFPGQPDGLCLSLNPALGCEIFS